MEKNKKYNIQNMIVTFCFLGVCLATQQIQTKAWNSGLIELSIDATGVLIAIVIMANYKWVDLWRHKIPYIVWAVVGTLGLLIGVPKVSAQRLEFLMADTIVLGLGIYLLGFCVIHTVIEFFVDKYRPKLYKPLIILWIGMLLWMIFSKSDYVWPECYFVLFLCYYFTKQDKQQRKNTITGMLNGIILGFLVIQSHAFLCRPFDRLGYYGNFCNPNHNSMFLCMCLVAILAKILMGVQEKRQWWMQIVFYLMATVCYSFIFMTGCKSGYLAVFVVTIFFLIGYCRVKGKMMFFRMGILLVALFVAIMPLTYLAVRYLPTIHPHVVFYFQEGYSEKWVHSWDPRDSEKYISVDELIEFFIWRRNKMIDSINDMGKEVGAVKNSELNIVSAVDYVPSVLLTAKTSEFVKHKDPDKIPVFDTNWESAGVLQVRIIIFKWYFDHLSLRGMPYDEQGFQLAKEHWIQDTHNIYLDYGINFGWPAMIMFTVFIWWGIGRLTRRGMKMRDPWILACLLVCLVPPVFGLFEYSWGPGMISTVAFYLAFKEMFYMDEEAGGVPCHPEEESIAMS